MAKRATKKTDAKQAAAEGRGQPRMRGAFNGREAGSQKMLLTLLDGKNKTVLADSFDPQAEAERRRFARRVLEREGNPSEVAALSVQDIADMVFQCYVDEQEAVAQRFKAAAEAKAAMEALPPPPPKTAITKAAAELAATESWLRDEAMVFLRDPDLLRRTLNDLDMLVAGERRLKLLCYLYGCSRLLKKPLNLIITGVTSSGKTFVRDSVIELFPPESKFVSTTLTENALYYMGEHELVHRMVCLGERKKDTTDANADRTTAARELISVGRLEKTLPMKIGGEMQAVKICVEGPVALSESTTVLQIEPEDQNRCVVINTDETSEQTIQCMEASDRSDETDIGNPKLAAAIDLHHAVQRTIQKCNVVIPFASTVTRLIQGRVSHNVEMRRAWPQCKQVIKAAALLFQFQRDRTERGSVIATLDDYEVARDLVGKWFTATIDGNISSGTSQFYEKALVAIGTEQAFTVPMAVKMKLGGKTAIRTKWLPELESVGAVEKADPPLKTSAGRTAEWYRLSGHAMQGDGPSILPPAEIVKEAMADTDYQLEEPEADEPVTTSNGEVTVTADGSLIVDGDDIEMLF